MHDKPGPGLSRSQLEYQLQWMLRQQPSDPSKMVEFLGDVIVTLIEKNNHALARHAAAEDARRPTRGGALMGLNLDPRLDALESSLERGALIRIDRNAKSFEPAPVAPEGITVTSILPSGKLRCSSSSTRRR